MSIRQLVVALVLAGLAASVGVVPAVAAEKDPATQPPEDAYTYVHRDFDHNLRLADAVKASSPVSDVIGYRYENGPIAGEFFPTDSKTVSQFLAEFADRYASSPQVTGVIIKEPSVQDDAGRREGPESPVSTEPIQTELVEDFVAAEVNLSEVKSRKSLSKDGESGSSQRGTTTATEWRPELVEADVIRDGDRILFTQFADWGPDASPDDVPDNYGFEFEVNIFNDKSTGLTQPFCEVDYEDQFIADYYSVQPANWEIVASGNTNAASLQPYWDTNGLDHCSRMTFSVGIRYPQLIEPDENGHYAFVSVDAAATDEDVDRLAASLQLVDDTECDYREDDIIPWADIDLPWCMGFWQIDPPSDVPNPRRVLSEQRYIYAPDFCWDSADFGETGGYKPSTRCGNSTSWDAVPMTEISPREGNPLDGWDVTITHQSDDLDYALYPYSASLPAISDEQPDGWTDEFRIADVRAWIDGEPVYVGHLGWDFEEALPVNNRFTVSNENMIIGDSSAVTMAKFFRNGMLSFRKGVTGEVNWIQMNGLHETWDPDAFDPFNCAVGTTIDGESTAQNNSVIATYNGDENCSFELRGDVTSVASFGTASHSFTRPGYLFHGDWSSGWIPREEHSVWRPANGSSFTVSYAIPSSTTLVPFYTGVQNSESTYVGQDDVPLAGYDSGLPEIDMEISHKLYTDYWSWDCRWVVEETPACESYVTDVKLNTAVRWPNLELGTNWRKLATIGGQISFTSSQGQPITIDLLPGSYYTRDGSFSGPPTDSRHP